MAVVNKKTGVYLIVSPTNKRYIGSSSHIPKRWNRYTSLKIKNQYALYNSFNKYGVKNHKFSILYLCDRDDVLFWERVFCDLYLSLADFPNGLNIRIPGYDDVSKSMSAEARERVKEGAKKRWDNPIEREKTSIRAKKALENQELRQKLRESANKQWTPEARKKKSQQMKDFFALNPEAKTRLRELNNKMFNDNPKEKENRYQSLLNYYKDNPGKRSEIAKKRYSDKPNPRAKKIIDSQSGEMFKSCKELSIIVGVSEQTIRNWLDGKYANKTNYKYI